MPMHEVKQGEHIVRIARQYGLTKPELVWDDPQNAALKEKRKNPNILFPGDQVFVPELKEKTESRPTGKLHRFQVDGQPLKLKLRVKDESDQPVADAPCRLNVQGRIEDKTTDGDGRIEQPIEPPDEDAMLDISGVQVPIKIGHLDPVEELSGQQARLNNLGYDAGPAGTKDDERFRSAVEEFQCDQNVKPITGICDSATQAKLKEVHGC
jgi:hypothetical protein